MTDQLLWGLLGYGILPLWLLAGLADYWLHQRTSIATTAGAPESRLHFVQTLEVGVPVLIVLFLELNLLALAVMVAAAVAHTVTAYWDVRYASSRRVILPFEQVVHAFLFTLPIFATALLVVMHWPAASAMAPGADAWSLRLRDPSWPTAVLVVVLGASLLFGLLPGLAEWWQSHRVARAQPRLRVDVPAPGRVPLRH
jgi:hypothetical protein